MKLLREYLSDITPLSSHHHTGKDFSSFDEIKNFVNAVKSKIDDLVTIFQSISPHILNRDYIIKHFKAINFCLEELDEGHSAETIARKIAQWFNINPKDFLNNVDPNSATSPQRVITSLLSIASKNNASPELLKDLNDSNGIFSTIVEFRIAHLKELKRIQEAERDLERSMIETEKVKQDRERSMITTEQIKQKRIAEEIKTADLQNELGRRQIKRQCIDPNESQGLAENDLRHSLNAMKKN
jgi:hypothetical protein